MAIVVGGPGIYLGGASAPPVPPFVNEYSMTFDGNLDYVNCGNNADFNTNDTVSISVWFKTSDGVTPVQTVVSKVFYRLQIQISSGISRVVWAVYYTGSQLQIITSPITKSYDDGLWHHVLAVYQSNTLGGMSLYIDGNLISTLDTQPQIFTSTNPLLIGARQTSNLLPFNGNIDEVAFWTNNQSANASTIYNGGAPSNLTSLSPLSWWRMGDGDSFSTNWTLIDNGSGGNDGTSVSMPEGARLPITPNSYSQNSFVFDGIGDYFNVANNTTIGRTQNISFSVWMKSNTTARQWIIGNPTSSNGGSALYVENTDILIFQLGDGTNDSYFNSRVSSLSTYAPTGQWNHILATFDGTDAKIFINGVLRNTWSPTTPYTISGWSNFYIGRRQANVSNMFNGYLDEVYIWDNDQSGNISTIYGNGVPTDISSLNPISHWRMGESATWDGANWTLTDQGSGGNDATSVSMPFEAKTGDQPYVL